jgi:glutathione S-transferase
MKLYQFSGSGFSWRVIFACSLKGITPELENLSRYNEGLKSPQFLALNRRGKVPVLEDADYILSESLAQLTYLNLQYPDPPLFGTSAQAHGKIWQRALDFDFNVAPLLLSEIIFPIFFGDVSQSQEKIKDGVGIFKSELESIEFSLESNIFIEGDAISAADVAIYPLIQDSLMALEKLKNDWPNLGDIGYPEKFPALQHWRERIQQLTAYQDVEPSLWKAFDG